MLKAAGETRTLCALPHSERLRLAPQSVLVYLYTIRNLRTSRPKRCPWVMFINHQTVLHAPRRMPTALPFPRLSAHLCLSLSALGTRSLAACLSRLRLFLDRLNVSFHALVHLD